MAWSLNEQKSEEERQQEKDETLRITKKAWEDTTEFIGNKYQEWVSPEIREGVRSTAETAAPIVADAWEGARTVQDWRDPGDVIAAGTARGLEGVYKAYDLAVEALAKETGIHRPWLDVADAAIPLTPTFIKGGVKVAKTGVNLTKAGIKSTVKTVDPLGLARASVTSAVAELPEDITTAFNLAKTYINKPPGGGLSPALAGGGSFDNAVNLAKGEFQPNTLFAAQTYTRPGAEAATTLARDLDMDYRLKTTYPSEPGKGQLFGKKVRGRTDVHHGGGLKEAWSALTNHASWKNLKEGAISPIVKRAQEKFGVFMGSSKANLMDMFSTNTMKRRWQKVDGIVEQTGGVLNKNTINDALGGTNYRPRDLSNVELIQFEELLKQGKVKNIEDFMNNHVSLDTGRVFPEGTFPDITVWAPGAKRGDKPLEVIKITTAAEHKNRFNLIFDALDRHKIDTKAARKSFNIKDIKTDPRLDMFGTDHSDTHNILNTLKYKEGNPLSKITKAIEDGTYHDLDLDTATEMLVDSHRFQEQVAGHVLQRRYGKIKELFTEVYPEGMPTLAGNAKWTDLGKKAKQKFIREHMNEIAVKGGLEKTLTIDEVLQPLKKWDKGMTQVFEWQPKPKLIRQTSPRTWNDLKKRHIERSVELGINAPKGGLGAPTWNYGDAQVTWYPKSKANPTQGYGQIDIMYQDGMTNPKGFKALLEDFEGAIAEFPKGTEVILNMVKGDVKRERLYTRLFNQPKWKRYIKRNPDSNLGWIYTAP